MFVREAIWGLFGIQWVSQFRVFFGINSVAQTYVSDLAVLVDID